MHHIALLDEENDVENVSSVKTARFKVKLIYLIIILKIRKTENDE